MKLVNIIFLPGRVSIMGNLYEFVNTRNLLISSGNQQIKSVRKRTTTQLEVEIEISSAFKNNTFYVTLQESVKRFFHYIPKVLINFGLSVMSF